MSDEASVKHIVDGISISLQGHLLLLELLHLLLKVGECLELLLDILLLGEGGSLVLSDLLLGPSPLRVDLHPKGGQKMFEIYRDNTSRIALTNGLQCRGTGTQRLRLDMPPQS